jgi:ribonuclease T
MSEARPNALAGRFRGFLPVVVDVETAGFNPKRDALLEIAAVLVRYDADDQLTPAETFACHVEPFPGSHLDERSLRFTGIDPFHPFRFAESEPEALRQIFQPIRRAVRESACSRAILVGHNPAIDLSFSSFDTATLAGLAYGQTVLARAVAAAGMEWEEAQAHSAKYDAERTAELFCAIVNRWDNLSAGR